MNIKIPARFIAALKYFAATQDIRYYLNGIYIEAAGDDTILVATDGHRIGYARVAATLPAGTQMIVPNDILRAVKAKGDVAIALDGNALTLTYDGATYSGKAIDGKYPEWRRTLPKELSGVAGQYNAGYLGDLGKVAAILVRAGKQPTIAQNGEGPAFISFDGEQNFYATLMPMRAIPLPNVPQWLKPVETKPIAKRRAVQKKAA